MEENNTPDIFAIKPETIWLPQEITDGAKAVKKAQNMIADHLFNDKKGVNEYRSTIVPPKSNIHPLIIYLKLLIYF